MPDFPALSGCGAPVEGDPILLMLAPYKEPAPGWFWPATPTPSALGQGHTAGLASWQQGGNMGPSHHTAFCGEGVVPMDLGPAAPSSSPCLPGVSVMCPPCARLGLISGPKWAGVATHRPRVTRETGSEICPVFPLIQKSYKHHGGSALCKRPRGTSGE